MHAEANAGYALRFSNTTAPFTIVVDSTVLKRRQHRRALRRRHRRRRRSRCAATRSRRPSPATATPSTSTRAPPARRPRRRSTARSLLDARRPDRERRAGDVHATANLRRSTGFSGTPNCPTADGNPLGNTKLMTSELRLDPDFAPLYDSPAVDSGEPGGRRRRASRPAIASSRRRAASSADICDAGPGVRDKGAYERYRPLPSVVDQRPGQLPGRDRDVQRLHRLARPGLRAGPTATAPAAATARRPRARSRPAARRSR